MLITMAESVPGREVATVLGVATGNVVRARFFVRDFLAGLRNIVGGEVNEYTTLMTDSREQAMARMQDAARAMGADAVICVRFGTATVAEGAAEILAYGTAVTLK